ncbi:bifunctional 2-polyprenyl-6-hydroxyphenol methylase/3-demethylubiquinol 3-O-methyltransferase UbiG [Mucilaginibacter sp. UR6-11]|uniref:class I SAM-dependent methyltransferase n=1 Tax=Mucilaginibacter sp. UR6-11 TaxID=1435644 RepID=UPI001E52454E|nr:methyltransferase domain-containing protein [Mucilaginibacter sp. UR6-11]MCC8426140.1 methyltransferase domain-containing protein [Mucilaginibacter sp. UR6-11]
MNDVLGQALNDYFHNQRGSKLWINNKYGPKEEMPVATYFRGEDDMPDIEWMALEQCRGKVLDIGAGAGSHALYLQEQGLDITAMDISPLGAAVMAARGVKKTLEADIFTYNQPGYDTLLLLMNGIGLAGTIAGLKKLLLHLKTLLNDDGQILFDSSDIAYLYEGKLPAAGYYGEIQYQYSYKKNKTEWFNWLYVDEQTLKQVALETGFNLEVLIEDEHGQYLTRLTKAV